MCDKEQQLTVSLTGLAFPVSEKLVSLLNAELLTQARSLDSNDVIFNFRDKSYSAESGGFHPVEIRLFRHHGVWHFDYITDFCWVGGPYPELAKEIDFNFPDRSGFSLYSGYGSADEFTELYEAWEGNFICCYWDKVFDEIKISTSD